MILAELYEFAADKGFTVTSVKFGPFNDVAEYTTATPDLLQSFVDDHSLVDAARQLDAEWDRTVGNVDLVAEVDLVLDELDHHKLNAGAARDFLVSLFNRFVDEQARRVRCDAVIVAPDSVKGDGLGPVVGYSLNGHLFGLDGRPFPNEPVEYTIIAVDE